MDSWLVIVSVLIGTGGLGGFATLLIKGRSENKKTEAEAMQTIVMSAKDIAIFRRGAIEDLEADVLKATERADQISAAFDDYKVHIRSEIDGYREELKELRRQLATIDDLRHQLDEMVVENSALREENAELLRRIEIQDVEIGKLKTKGS